MVSAIRQAQTKRARLVEAVEQPLDARAPRLGGKRGADGMGSEQPAGADGAKALAPPAPQPAREAFGQRFGESLRIGRAPGQPGEAGRGAVQPFRMVGEIDAEADDDRVVGSLEEDARELGAARQEVVGPFDRDRLALGEGGDGLVERDGGDQSERRGRRVVAAQADERARIEIARWRNPVPALPAPAAGLALGAKPEPLGGAAPRKGGYIVVGGPRLGDELDQNRAPAAFIEAASSSGMAR